MQVESLYDEERSSPEESYFFFAYQVRISNEGEETAQLLSREWIITDAQGREQRVQGPGVVGEQPVLRPGEMFEYTSFCPLPTPVGTMHGSYQMVTRGGERFDAEIATRHHNRIGEFDDLVDTVTLALLWLRKRWSAEFLGEDDNDDLMRHAVGPRKVRTYGGVRAGAH